MPNYYLGDAQNAVDGLDIAGRRVHDPDNKTSTAGDSTPERRA